MSELADNFTPARIFDTEGARVGIITCKKCGAAVFLDPSDPFSTMDLHMKWHTLLMSHYHYDRTGDPTSSPVSQVVRSKA